MRLQYRFPSTFHKRQMRLECGPSPPATRPTRETCFPFPMRHPVLFVRGTLTANALSAAIVGSRRATLYGRGQAERFAAALAEAGVVVVSGGAAGIDTTAHKATLAAGGITVAVLGCGPDYSYPSENKALFAQIVERGGAVISEYPIGTTPEPYRFPARNRIIAALSKATIVIESPEDSGALITARCAAEYGRAVLAVPGAVDTGRSRGCHELIRDGATIADTPDDVFLALGLPLQNGKVAQAVLPIDSPPVPPAARKKAAMVTSAVPKPAVLPAPFAAAPVSDVVELQVSVPLLPNEQKFLMQLSSAPRHLDDVAASAELSASDAGVAAIFLEMKSLVRRLPGNLFVRP